MKETYCSECGCEILSEDDVGYTYTDIEIRKPYPMLKGQRYEKIEREFTVCIWCNNEHVKAQEEFSNSEFDIGN